jgi:hypothetical protein
MKAWDMIKTLEQWVADMQGNGTYFEPVHVQNVLTTAIAETIAQIRAEEQDKPTPREQELEARVTALLAVLDECDAALLGSCGIMPDLRNMGNINAALEAIKKAREVGYER